MQPPLTAERLRELLSYDPETGEFRWREIPWQSKRAQAGCLDKSTGYIRIGISGTRYWAHRLAWLYVTGEWPVRQVDHRNLVRSDNRFNNLRQADISQQRANMSKRKDNTSGHRGVYLIPSTGMWLAKMMWRGRRIHLGHFTTIDGAIAARRAANVQHFGEFAPENRSCNHAS